MCRGLAVRASVRSASSTVVLTRARGIAQSWHNHGTISSGWRVTDREQQIGGYWATVTARSAGLVLLALVAIGCGANERTTIQVGAETTMASNSVASSASTTALPPPNVGEETADALMPKDVVVDPEQWSRFPATADPRPLVLTEQYVIEQVGQRGYIDNEDAKAAVGSGAIDLPADIPVSPLTAGGFPLLSATDAVARNYRRLGSDPNSPRVGATKVALGIAPFQTDRGPQELPAWRLTFPNVEGSVAILAVADSAIFEWTGIGSTEQAKLSADGRTITLMFTGAEEGTGDCTSEYTLTARESTASVELNLVEHPFRSGATCLAIGYGRSASATLDRPLAGRVVVLTQFTGPAPVAVTSA